MKDLSYLEAFDKKIIREARRIINHGTTIEDIDKYLSQPSNPIKKARRIPKKDRNRAFKNIQWGKRSP